MSLIFIAFEGIDGCGKTVQANLLEQTLINKIGSSKVCRTMEPGGWSGGKSVREILLHGNLQHPYSELFLFLYDRCEHVSKIILPNLKANNIVICERFQASTIAYQGNGMGLSVPFIKTLHQELDFPEPDIIFFLDISLKKAVERMQNRCQKDRFEEKDLSFFNRVREGYLSLLNEDDKNQWCQINAEKTVSEIQQIILDRIIGKMGN